MKHYTKIKRTAALVAAVFLPVILALFLAALRTDYRKGLATITSTSGVVSLVHGEFPSLKEQSIEGVVDTLASLGDIYGFDNPEEELVLNKAMQNAGGFVLDFDQYHNGIPVFPRSLKVAIDKELQIESISGNYLKDIKVANSIAIPEADAIDAALADGGELIKSRLVIYTLYDVVPVYCYEVNTTLNGGMSFYINAQTSAVEASLSLSTNAITPHNSIQTDYFSNQVELTIAKNDDGTYALIDGYRNINVKYSNDVHDAIGTQYTSDTELFNNKSLNHPTAISALKSLAEAFDFYTNSENIGVSVSGVDDSVLTDSFGVSPLTNQKQMNLIIAVNAGYDNASCSPNYPQEAFTTFFIGDYRAYGATPDIIYHEYQHSVTRQLASLIYENESGAIDEALADLFAGLVEGKPISDPEGGFWLIAEDMPATATTAGGTMRSAIRPWLYAGGRWNTAYAARFCYEEGDHARHDHCDYGGVHYNATIITYSFYQMAMKAVEIGLSSFNNQNLGLMLYSTLQKLPSDCTWLQFADIFGRAPYVLSLSEAEREAMIGVIRFGFIASGIYNRLENQVVIRFSLGEGQEGELSSEVIAPLIGETFTIPSMDITSELGGTLIGFSETPRNPSASTLYVVGETYQAPILSLTLYPVFMPNRWDNFSFSGFSGAGSEADPYLIGTASDLAALSYYMNSGLAPAGADYQEIEDKHFKLTSDIDLKQIDFSPIGLYKSLAKRIHLDGNNHAIKNLKITGASSAMGLFGYFSGELKRIGIASGSINASADTLGGLVGLLEDGGSIKNCYNKATIVNSKSSGIAGGIVGRIIPTGLASVTSGVSEFGGIPVSFEQSSIIDCLNSGRVESSVAGGIVGRVLSESDQSAYDKQAITTIGNCINAGLIYGSTAGGILGIGSNIAFVNCINDGTIAAAASSSTLGGIVGQLNDYTEVKVYYASAFLSCKNAGLINKGSGLASVGSLIGSIAIYNQMYIKLENNTVSSQAGLSYSGTVIQSDFNPQEGITSSTDALDFDFFNRDYYLNARRWSVANGVSSIDFLTGWQFDEYDYPQPIAPSVSYWEEARAASFSGGNGSVATPYEISSAPELALLLYNVNNNVKDSDGVFFSQKAYLQTADIDLAGKLWTGIGYVNYSASLAAYDFVTTAFSGSYDGGGFSISGMLATEKLASGDRLSLAAFFSAIGGAKSSSISNVRLLNMVADGEIGAAGIALVASGEFLIKNTVVEGKITSRRGSAAALVAQITSINANDSGMDEARQEIVACLSLASVSAPTAAGIVGISRSQLPLTIKNCVNKGDVYNLLMGGYYSKNITAGIVASVARSTRISGAINAGSVTNYGFGYSSGICGYLFSGVDELIIEDSKQAASVISVDPLNVSSIISSYFGSYSGVSVKGSDYVTDAEPSLIKKLQLESSSLITEDEFAFDSLDYFTSSENFSHASETYWLYILMNYEEGYAFVCFVGHDERVVEIHKVEASSSVSLPKGVFTRASDYGYDYTFAGWAREDGSLVSGQSVVAVTDMVMRESFLAEPKLFNVQFKNADGSLISSEMHRYGEVVSRADPSKKGYKFVGWYLDAQLEVEAGEVLCEGELTLYAKWEKTKSGCGSMAFSPALILPLTALLILVYVTIKQPKRRTKTENLI